VSSPVSSRGWRGHETWALYAGYGIGAFGINGLGSVLLPLQQDLGVGRSAVAFYPTLFALSTILAGLVGSQVSNRVGEARLLVIAYVSFMVGAALFWVDIRWATAVGALLLGIGGAAGILVIPVRLARLHPRRSTVALTESNAVASLSAILAPVLVAATLATGVGWRFGYLLPILVLSAAMVVRYVPRLRSADPQAAPDDAVEVDLRRGPVLGRWSDAVLAVSAEFSLVFWAATALAEWHDVETAVAVVAAGMFLVGMAAGRIFAGPVVGRYPARTVTLGGAGIGIAGFVVYWSSPVLGVAAGGLALAGVGISVLYPVAIGRLIAARPDNPVAGASLGALAIGLSVGAAPVALSWLADGVGMRQAYLVVPIFLGLLVLKNLRRAPARG